MSLPQVSGADLAWDAFVDANPRATYLQLSGWARTKAANGWRPWPLDGSPGIGARILLRRPAGVPWTFAYAPRGPLATAWDRASLAAFTERVRAEGAGSGRISHLRVDPEIELDGPDDADGSTRRYLAELGWRPAPEVQPKVTRIVDLTGDEAALWGDLRGKWRQYVNRARSGGVRIEERGREDLPAFHAIMTETSARAGSPIRTEASYRAIWDAFAPAGRVRLLFALAPDGVPQAVLFLIRAGSRVVEPYGGMTAAGAESRANYLLKWEAIRSSRAAGGTSYDMWGLVHPGIRQFKEGFGGREVRLIGAFDLDLRSLGAWLYRTAESRRGPRRAGSAPPSGPGPGPE
ncbi:MAG TPA: peptidoglycan bridge formation glycyltransferase FemA/FemB family protein [Candidatus Limnocylindrales bacterium]